MSRETMLEKIRQAIGKPQVTPDIPRAYRQATNAPNLLTLLEERLTDYRAEVHITDATQLAPTIRGILERLHVQRLAIPHDLPKTWLPDHLELLPDSPDLTATQLEQADAVLTSSASAIAETGTIILDHAALQGRRVLTLIPDKHICVVFEQSIVDNLPNTTALLTSSITAARPITFISGPSATSDIELSRVEGVHGPRTLEVILVRNPPLTS